MSLHIVEIVNSWRYLIYCRSWISNIWIIIWKHRSVTQSFKIKGVCSWLMQSFLDLAPTSGNSKKILIGHYDVHTDTPSHSNFYKIFSSFTKYSRKEHTFLDYDILILQPTEWVGFYFKNHSFFYYELGNSWCTCPWGSTESRHWRP